MNEATPLTNSERRDDVAYLAESYSAAARRPTPVLDDEACARYTEGDADDQTRLFFTLLCYGALAAQPAPEAVVESDWRRLVDAGVVERLFDGKFDLRAYAMDPPVSRGDSKGKVIDFMRLAETRDTWSRLLPQPPEPEVVIDVLYAASGGALKSRAFWVVREMRRLGLWHDEALDRFGFVPDGRVRKRAVRMGLIDLPEKADTFADMKAVSRSLHAVMRLNGDDGEAFDLPVSWAAQRCELCDATRMAGCPMPHCRWRRSHTAV